MSLPKFLSPSYINPKSKMLSLMPSLETKNAQQLTYSLDGRLMMTFRGKKIPVIVGTPIVDVAETTDLAMEAAFEGIH